MLYRVISGEGVTKEALTLDQSLVENQIIGQDGFRNIGDRRDREINNFFSSSYVEKKIYNRLIFYYLNFAFYIFIGRVSCLCDGCYI